jgi:hypothetical protein
MDQANEVVQRTILGLWCREALTSQVNEDRDVNSPYVPVIVLKIEKL